MTPLPELIAKCLKKDARSEYLLYQRYFNVLMRICWRYEKNEDDAAALLNKGFLKILNNLDKYDVSHAFEPWIRAIMVNTIIDEFRMNKKYQFMEPCMDMAEIDTGFHPLDANAAE